MQSEEHSKGALIVCGGCNAKIGAGDLSALLKDLPRVENPNMLIGFDHSDDAAVIKVNDETALIQTLDFFPAPVSDPYLFGQIAAANALSDVYAMGGVPLSALNIVAFPEGDDYTVLKEILRGGAEKVQEAGAVLAGGHSIHDSRPKYGLSVNGTAHPQHIWRNNGAKIGDVLFLTKPLGVGIITAAYNVGEISDHAFKRACDSMSLLNKYAADFFRTYDIHACTDITGFGLLGHLLEMLDADKSAILKAQNIPYIPEARHAAEEFLLTAGGQRNRNHTAKDVRFEIKDFALEEILFDPQTSGGLLFAVSASDAEKIRTAHSEILKQEIGTITARKDVAIIVS